MQAMNLLKRATSELIKLKPDGTVDGTDHHIALPIKYLGSGR
jgi:hypothetical protein